MNTEIVEYVDVYPRVAWENPTDGVRVVEYREEGSGPVLASVEVCASYDLMGRPVWTPAYKNHSEVSERVMRVLLRYHAPAASPIVLEDTSW